MIAVFLYAQLEESEKITAKRMHIWNSYDAGLKKLTESGKIRGPYCPAGCEHNAHMYYILLKDLDERTRLIDFMKERAIMPVFHYVPLHSAPKGVELCGKLSLPVTEEYADRLLRLPCYFELTDEEIGHVLDSIYDFFGIAR